MKNERCESIIKEICYYLITMINVIIMAIRGNKILFNSYESAPRKQTKIQYKEGKTSK